jgi:hypothetical protein
MGCRAVDLLANRGGTVNITADQLQRDDRLKCIVLFKLLELASFVAR